MKVFGKLNRKDQHLLQLAQMKIEGLYGNEIKKLLKKKKVFWVNFFCAGQPAFHFERQEGALFKAMMELVNSIVTKYNLPKRVLSMGVSINPKGTKDQFPHIDYEGFTSSIFIPLTPVVTQNTIAYFDPELSDKDKERIISGLSAKEHYILLQKIESEIFPRMKETRRGFKPFSLVYLPAGLVHRAVANNSGYDRKMLCIMLTNDTNYLLDEKETEQGV